MNALIDVARDQVLVAAVQFGVRLFNQRDPDLVDLLAACKDKLLRLDVDRESLINDDVDPLEVLEEAEHIQTDSPELVEDGRPDAFRQGISESVTDDHVLVVIHARNATNQQLVSEGEIRHRRNEPAVTEVALDAVL